MILWVNRLYPKQNTISRTPHARVGNSSGDTNLYYTLPTTVQAHSTTHVQNQSAQVVRNESVSSVRHHENRVSTVNHLGTQSTENSQVVYQTTVQVDMVNHNQIHGEQDMNRLVQYLRDALQETLASSAEGVM